MFHRPNKSTSGSVSETNTPSVASTLKDDVKANVTEVTEMPSTVKSVMKSPASFLQTQQNIKTETQAKPITPTQKEEIKTMDVKDDTMEKAMDASAAATAARTSVSGFSAGNTAYNAGSTFSSTPTAATNYDRDTGRKLVVGQGINMSGEIDSCDHLIVEGTVEAALKGAAILDIFEKGTFFGTVEIEEATIAGKFEGDLVVHGRLTLRASADVSGTISYGELSVEAGAQMQGMIRPASAMATEVSMPAKKKTATAKKLKAANGEESEAETQLPFTAGAATA
jgi:cytoskeletal protein CcmA (bactofilin family)